MSGKCYVVFISYSTSTGRVGSASNIIKSIRKAIVEAIQEEHRRVMEEQLRQYVRPICTLKYYTRTWADQLREKVGQDRAWKLPKNRISSNRTYCAMKEEMHTNRMFKFNEEDFHCDYGKPYHAEHLRKFLDYGDRYGFAEEWDKEVFSQINRKLTRLVPLPYERTRHARVNTEDLFGRIYENAAKRDFGRNLNRIARTARIGRYSDSENVQKMKSLTRMDPIKLWTVFCGYLSDYAEIVSGNSRYSCDYRKMTRKSVLPHSETIFGQMEKRADAERRLEGYLQNNRISDCRMDLQTSLYPQSLQRLKDCAQRYVLYDFRKMSVSPDNPLDGRRLHSMTAVFSDDGTAKGKCEFPVGRNFHNSHPMKKCSVSESIRKRKCTDLRRDPGKTYKTCSLLYSPQMRNQQNIRYCPLPSAA